MGMLVALVMGLIIASPVSSAAVAISLGLSGLAAGASTVGCAAYMIGFAVTGFRDNRWSGVFAHILGTPKLQMANVLKNPKILIAPALTSFLLGGVSTTVFMMQNSKVGAGMGTSGLVGQLTTLEIMGFSALIPIVLLHFIFPAVLTFVISRFLWKKGLVKLGDHKI